VPFNEHGILDGSEALPVIPGITGGTTAATATELLRPASISMTMAALPANAMTLPRLVDRVGLFNSTLLSPAGLGRTGSLARSVGSRVARLRCRVVYDDYRVMVGSSWSRVCPNAIAARMIDVESLCEAIRDARTAPTRSKHLLSHRVLEQVTMDRAAFPHSRDAALSRRCSCDARSGGPVRLQGCRVVDQFAYASAGRSPILA
jgi:hypothetical protein